ncbi:UBAP1-MVB12-associated (UMA)-domain containing protein 1 [Genypterus blacodes]|uniref:UBAP1-MVB12-associated (UMA)-domain containing protein 1 n=1 Tax=Genypterus blacodes TaxID=154954 RepID=UPI003F75AE7E
MFSFLGLRKDSKKSTTEQEVEGGFVIVGETVEEQQRMMQAINIVQPSTNVIVHPSKSSCSIPAQHTDPKLSTALTAIGPTADPSLQDLLGDVPFALAPHVLAMQAGFTLMPDVLLSRDINYNLANFHYDFTLENSVLYNV